MEMTSKRNSRVYADESAISEKLEQGNPALFRSRRNSRSSIQEKEAFAQAAADEEEAQKLHNPPSKAMLLNSRSHSTPGSGKETPPIVTPRATETSVHETTFKPPIHHSVEFPAAPLHGRPLNFGVVIPGVYRSSYPKPEDYAYLKGLKLKTVVTLVKKDELDGDLFSFVNGNGIRQIRFNMQGTKKEPIPMSTMASILQVLLDQQNHPLLLHCNHGKHRTGCVVAVARKLSGWALHSVLDEYRAYAMPKVRECDVEYISKFQTTLLPLASAEMARFSPVQVRAFLRTLLFSSFVMVIWLVSGSQFSPPEALPIH